MKIQTDLNKEVFNVDTNFIWGKRAHINANSFLTIQEKCEVHDIINLSTASEFFSSKW